MKENKVEEINKRLGFLKMGMEPHPTKGFNMEYLKKPNAIAVMILDEKGENTLLVEQYRPGAGESMLEIPAGIIDPGETPLETLKRETREETGYDLEDFHMIHDGKDPYYVSPGYSTEAVHIYIVRLKDDTTVVKPLDLDEGEDLITKWVPLEKLMEESLDMKTVLAYQMYTNKNKVK